MHHRTAQREVHNNVSDSHGRYLPTNTSVVPYKVVTLPPGLRCKERAPITEQLSPFFMEHALVRLAETAAWLFFIVFLFAAIGVIATIRWIIALVTNTERTVETGIQNVEDRITHRQS